jgi:hypothetical protein
MAGSADFDGFERAIIRPLGRGEPPHRGGGGAAEHARATTQCQKKKNYFTQSHKETKKSNPHKIHAYNPTRRPRETQSTAGQREDPTPTLSLIWWI